MKKTILTLPLLAVILTASLNFVSCSKKAELTPVDIKPIVYQADNITVKVDNDANANTAVNKTLTKTGIFVMNKQTKVITLQAADYVITDSTVEQKTGERYQLVITNLQQDPNDSFLYSGVLTLGFPEGVITDLSGNANSATTITIGVDEPENDTTIGGPYLPLGFSWVNGEHTEIKDSLNNQYVWISVPRDATVYKDLIDDTEDDL